MSDEEHIRKPDPSYRATLLDPIDLTRTDSNETIPYVDYEANDQDIERLLALSYQEYYEQQRERQERELEEKRAEIKPQMEYMSKKIMSLRAVDGKNREIYEQLLSILDGILENPTRTFYIRDSKEYDDIWKIVKTMRFDTHKLELLDRFIKLDDPYKVIDV